MIRLPRIAFMHLEVCCCAILADERFVGVVGLGESHRQGLIQIVYSQTHRCSAGAFNRVKHSYYVSIKKRAWSLNENGLFYAIVVGQVYSIAQFVTESTIAEALFENIVERPAQLRGVKHRAHVRRVVEH